MKSTGVFIERYRKKGFRLTPQRIAILEYLKGNSTHPTADDIYRAIKKKHSTVSFATVYNTIAALREINEITELTIDPERKHYDPNTGPHHHIVCVKCDKIGDVFMDYSSSLVIPREVLRRFKVTRNHVNFYGVCRDCAARGDPLTHIS